ncbi:MAG TPA: extracellular solute-binding protein [Pseudonocardiaceae bacterium]|nr:extracellular solute-binding protein [Pseudonocardiaceae bacterium]
MYRLDRRGWAVVLPLVLATTVVAGCGTSSSGATSATSTIPTGSALVTAAEKEGSLTFYASFSNKELAALAKAFNATYPGIKVDILQSSVDKLTSRLMVEQKAQKFNADLFQGDASYANQLIAAGALQPYSPADEPSAPPGLDVPQGYRNVDSALTTVIAYNPTVIKQRGMAVPTSFADFAQPQWKGQFSADASGVNWYQSLMRSMGQARAKTLITRIGANSPRLSESHTLSLTQVEGGEPVATIAAYGYSAVTAAESNPTSVAVVNPNPLPSAADLVELVKGAPHPDAAALYMTWLLSKAGQQTLISISGRISLRTDVRNDPHAWNPAEWQPVWSTPSVSATRFNADAATLKTAFGEQ